MPTVSVIVPARDCERTIGRTLDGLTGQDVDGGREVLVVDNGSHDATAEVAEAHPAVDRVIRRARGDGPGAARNAGADAAAAERLAFLDADCVPEDGWLAAGVAALDEADLVQGEVRPDADIAVGPFDRTLSVTRDSGLFESANLLVRRETFERAGGFPDGLEPQDAPPFGEDVLFGWTAVRHGARYAFSADVRVRHAVVRREAEAFVLEYGRRRLFPLLVRRVPELREALLWRRWFISHRTAAFDVAVLALLAARARRPAALAAALPYLALVVADARPWGPRLAWKVAAAGVAADAVGAAALVAGSAKARTLVL